MTIKQWIKPLNNWNLWIYPTIFSLFLVTISQKSYVAFHTVAEFSTMVISFMMFACVWVTRYFNKNNFFLFLACGFFWVGVLDLIHALTYKGVNIIVTGDPNLAAQFWLSARYLEAGLFLISPIFAHKKINANQTFCLLATIAIAVSLIIFGGKFPIAYQEHSGLTPFKIISEYFIICILILSILSLFHFAKNIPKDEKVLTSTAIIIMIASEFCFTQYQNVYGNFNLWGHLLKIFSFWFIFQSIIIFYLKKPYIDLKNSEARFRRLFENSEVSICDEDMSELITALEDLRATGITDLRQYLHHQPEFLEVLRGKLRILDVNKVTLDLLGITHDRELPQHIDDFFAEESTEVFISGLCAIWEHQKCFRSEVSIQTYHGQKINVIISFQIPEDINEFYSIPVSIVDITERKRNEEIIFRQANFDFLTNLANRNLFYKYLSSQIEIAFENNSEIALFYIDIDRFKHINDSLGHSIGDQLLQQVSERMIQIMDQSEPIFRLGGDEFAILILNSQIYPDLEIIIRKILDNISQPYEIHQSRIYITASVGVTVFPKDGIDALTLLRKADSAMYRAKAIGKNSYKLFMPKMDEEVQERRSIEQDLRRALEQQQFTLYYQPIIHIHQKQVMNTEALIRWLHPQKGLIPPDKFIPLAEEIGLIQDIGEWVLRRACLDAVEWTHYLKNSPGVSVNLSSIQFKTEILADQITEVLAETGLDPNQLTLEMTESVMMDNESSLFQLKRIRELGISLAVDDFGTGYSSLSYLKQFPVTSLKIDRSFITELPKNQDDIELVKAILSMAKSLKLKVVAEGIETLQQEHFLRDQGCNYGQGYLYSKPIAFEDLIPYLKRSES